ncbi:unnamed protein product [marine sediment metagenome]|uniref:DUF5678 domain-containing protein n=1 Tax=marine sediment metagenome TaxID=412755 RepID=X0T9T9_9ZZZZ
MEIERKIVEEITIEEFAERHNLIMEIRDRGLKSEHPRYYASFKNSEIEGDGVLIGAYENGETEEEAIQGYAKRISEETLVINARKSDEQRIKVPILKET